MIVLHDYIVNRNIAMCGFDQAGASEYSNYRLLRESGGTAVSVSDSELMEAARKMAASEGVFAAPEGGACLSALENLLESGLVSRGERVVLFNTGAGVKYVEAFRGMK